MTNDLAYKLQQGAEKLMRTPAKIAAYAILGTSILGASMCSIKSTDTNEVGVRTAKIGLLGDRGVQDQVYQSGQTHFVPVLFNDWHTYDTKRVNLEWTLENGETDLKFKTAEGNDIRLDVKFSYQIDPGKTPYILANVAQSNEELEAKIIWTKARNTIRDQFNALSTDDFYRAASRNRAVIRAEEQLNDELAEYGIAPNVNIEPGNFEFVSEAFNDEITLKVEADADFQTQQSTFNATPQRNLRLLAEADQEVTKMITKADGEFRIDSTNAVAYLERRTQEAAAILTEGRNQAEAIREQRQAMATSGGRTFVQMRIAEALQGKRIIPYPDMSGSGQISTFDVNAWLQSYVAKDAANQEQ